MAWRMLGRDNRDATGPYEHGLSVSVLVWLAGLDPFSVKTIAGSWAERMGREMSWDDQRWLAAAAQSPPVVTGKPLHDKRQAFRGRPECRRALSKYTAGTYVRMHCIIPRAPLNCQKLV